MTTRRIIELLDGRYVFYPIQKEWYKANGGVTVSRSHVAKACKIQDADLIRYEEVQSAGVDHTLAGAYRR